MRLTGLKMKVTFNISGKKVDFKSDGDKRHDLGDGWSLVQADVVLADGTECDAILQICEKDAGEHWDTYIFSASGLVKQGENNFLTAMHKTQDEVFPYKYKYRTQLLNCVEDFHVNEDGWSR
jgi:hypothetical protein